MTDMTEPAAQAALAARLQGFAVPARLRLTGTGGGRLLGQVLAALAVLQLAAPPAPPPPVPRPGDSVAVRMERIFHAQFCSSGHTDVPVPDVMRPLLRSMAEQEIAAERRQKGSDPGIPVAPALPGPAAPGAPAPGPAPTPLCPCGGTGAGLATVPIRRRKAQPDRPGGGALHPRSDSP